MQRLCMQSLWMQNCPGGFNCGRGAFLCERHPPTNKGPLAQRGLKGGPRVGPPRGILVEIVENGSKQPNQCVKRLFRAS